MSDIAAFLNDPETASGLASVLAAHGECGWNADFANPLMTCGDPLPPIYEDADIHAAHQAAAVLAYLTGGAS